MLESWNDYEINETIQLQVKLLLNLTRACIYFENMGIYNL